MSRSYASMTAGFGLATLVAALSAVACSDDESSNNGGTGATGGSSSGGSSSGGTAGSGTGGSTTGGTAGSGTGGSTGGSAGSGGGGDTGPFACAGKLANCDTFTEFSTSGAQSWGSGDFAGGVTVFPSGNAMFSRDTSTDGIHVTGTVSGYGFGFGLWANYCSDLSAYDGVAFNISGTTGTTPTANQINFEIQVNSDYPWNFSPADKKGACTGTDPMNPFGSCISPSIPVEVGTGSEIEVLWADMMGGTPTAWNAETMPKEVIGIQFQFPWSETAEPYDVDVTLEDLRFIGGNGTSCSPQSGSGGAGGTGGTGGTDQGGAGGDEG